MQCRARRMRGTAILSSLPSPTPVWGFLRTIDAVSSIHFLRPSMMARGLAWDCRARKRSFASTKVISTYKAFRGREPLLEFSFRRRIDQHQIASRVLHLGNDLARLSRAPIFRGVSNWLM